MMQKRILLFLFSFLCITAMAQTKEIALKSHSGNLANFDGTGEGNLGIVEPMPVTDSIVKINDTTVICYTNHFGNYNYQVDTLVNVPEWLVPNLNTDSLKKNYYPHTVFRGFDNLETPQTEKEKAKSKGKNKRKKLKSERESEFIPISPTGGGNSPSNKLPLLLLFTVVLVSILFLSYKRKLKTTIAS